MTIAELTSLIHGAGDCTVTFTTINVPDTSRGHMYGIVEWWDRQKAKRTFHSEEELRQILKRIAL